MLLNLNRILLSNAKDMFCSLQKSRNATSSERGLEWGLSLYAPVIVKYRDEKTDAATRLEDVLR